MIGPPDIMSTHHGQPRSSSAIPPDGGGGVYNLLPIHDVVTRHPSLRFAEVRASMAALRAVGELRRPPFSPHEPVDIMEWLGSFFGFQRDNVRNQREHLVLLLANAQMRLHNPAALDSLDPSVVRRLRRKLLSSYDSWCSFLDRASNIWISGRQSDPRRELLYIALYLLIWGEAANIRFVPECLCYIFHHMAMELNRILEGYLDESTGAPALPSSHGENAFLDKIITPIYNIISAEFAASKNGTAPHSSWRNYDDFNEYFWSERCFGSLGWPMNLSSEFFVAPPNRNRVGKTGFVELRSFWNLYRAFDRLWVMLILFLQLAIIVAWNGDTYPWQGLRNRDVQVKALSVFITWGGLRFLQSLLDWGTQYKLVSRRTKLLAARMVLKTAAAISWTLAFIILYIRIWVQYHDDGGGRDWSKAANNRVFKFMVAAFVFLIPELLVVALFLVPRLRGIVEQSNWKVVRALTWWFQSRTFVGRGLWEGMVDSALYGFFWVVVLAVKFSFSYFLQIKPLVAPTKSILRLPNVQYRWYHFFGGEFKLGVGLLWLPVVLIYLMDLQIWYTIASAFVGALVGLFDHIGEIRDVHQLRLRFQFFASALQFNILPEDQVLPVQTISSRFRNAIHRLKLRYGFGHLYEKIESNQLSKTRFQLVWNEIISAFREEDIVSDHEQELLEMPPSRWGIRVIRWPCFLLGNELQIALKQVKELKRLRDNKIWKKICKHEYRRCAVVEAYDSVRFLLLEILGEGSEERSIVSSLFSSIEDSIKAGKFTEDYKLPTLESIHSSLVKITGMLVNPKEQLDKEDVKKKFVKNLQTLYEIVTKDLPTQRNSMEQMQNYGWVPVQQNPSSLLFDNAVELPRREEDPDFYRQVRRLHAILISKDSMINVPKNLGARRRIAFFSNSLFMSMPRAPQVEKMRAFSVLTPYYQEEVLFTREQIDPKNEDGISILFYLRKIYADEWENFLERMVREGLVDRNKILEEKLADVKLWASLRGQTLTRTIRGMMYYYRALKMLAFLDTASEVDMNGQSRELISFHSDHSLEGDGTGSERRSPPQNLTGDDGSRYEDHVFGLSLMKFTYVAACQLYGKQRDKSLGMEIFNLMKNNEALRVAYPDEVNTGRGASEHYSVLVKYDSQLEKEVEIYRIKLPGPLKLGEGKPENQNHAIIFTRGDAVQTIDMNQDNYFEEALKMRNLLEEFGRKHGARKPTLLGVREHIFTGSVSSLAWFMSSQESSFVTLGQRVLANPLKIRMHYGHPDVFDRIWFLSRGGISKGSKVINISEDIFAGFNCTLRGGNVTHHDYIQVGKGRDVGLNQISLFEAKVSSGNGEQVSSRDVYRLGHRLDFFRMLSFFYTTVGFYCSTQLVVLTVFAFVWARLYLALSGLENSILGSASNNAALGSILNQQFIIQLGLFTALPMIVENSLEHGFIASIWDFIKMQLQLSSVFFTFSMGTRSHFFGRTILHGGAKYQATGRGFVVEHKSFCENYRLYARSHFTKAIELGLVLIVYASYSPIAKNSFVYIALTISSWFLVLSWLLAPFLFNPSGFEWLKTVDDFDGFMNWIWYRGGLLVPKDRSWEVWWYSEIDHLRTTGFWGKLLETVLVLRFFIIQYGIVYRFDIANGSRSIGVYLLSWIYIVVVIGVFLLVGYARDRYSAKEHIYYRAVQSLIILGTILAIILLHQFTHFTLIDIFTSLLAFIPTGWGLISFALVIRPLLERTAVMWEAVVSLARFYETLFGLIVFVPVVILSWTPGFQSMQSRILFNEAFSRGLEISRILTGKRDTGRRGKKDT